VSHSPEPAGSSSDGFYTQLAYLAVGGYYDHQKLRQAHMNRVRDLIRKKNEGLPFDKTEKKKETKKFDKKYRDENLSALLDDMTKRGLLTGDEIGNIQKLLRIAKAEKSLEEQYKPIVKWWVEKHPAYINFLSNIKGLHGPILSGGLLALFDIRKADHPSSFWKYAGLAPVEGRGVRKVHGQKFDFNPQARTLCWKIEDSFIKQRTPKYSETYYRVKPKEMNKHCWMRGCTVTGKDNKGKDIIDHKCECWQWSKEKKNWVYEKCKSPTAHVDNRAKRIMIKEFLQDFWLAWRKLEGLPISEPYAIAVLKHTKG